MSLKIVFTKTAKKIWSLSKSLDDWVIGVVNILKLIHVEISSFEILNIITFNEERLHCLNQKERNSIWKNNFGNTVDIIAEGGWHGNTFRWNRNTWIQSELKLSNRVGYFRDQKVLMIIALFRALPIPRKKTLKRRNFGFHLNQVFWGLFVFSSAPPLSVMINIRIVLLQKLFSMSFSSG